MELQTMPLRFRVWDTLQECWLFPYSRHKDSVCHYEFSSYELLCRVELVKMIIKDGRFVISQDTGLKDNNGESIYTGDIVKFGAVIAVIEYNYGTIQYYRVDGRYFIAEAREAEVIGNIWQNPELLKEDSL